MICDTTGRWNCMGTGICLSTHIERLKGIQCKIVSDAINRPRSPSQKRPQMSPKSCIILLESGYVERDETQSGFEVKQGCSLQADSSEVFDILQMSLPESMQQQRMEDILATADHCPSQLLSATSTTPSQKLLAPSCLLWGLSILICSYTGKTHERTSHTSAATSKSRLEIQGVSIIQGQVYLVSSDDQWTRVSLAPCMSPRRTDPPERSISEVNEY